MDPLLVLLVIVIVVAFVFRPAQTRVVYVPMEPVETRDELGCLPLIVLGLVALVVLGVIRL